MATGNVYNNTHPNLKTCRQKKYIKTPLNCYKKLQAQRKNECN